MTKYYNNILILLLSFAFLLSSCNSISVTNPIHSNELPDIYPDYVDITIPINIAPLDFGMKSDDYNAIVVSFAGTHGDTLTAKGKKSIEIDSKKWQKLLADNTNDSISVSVYGKKGDDWYSFRPYQLYVVPDSIDYSIVYRLIAPGYQTYSKMGIYQRSLANYKQNSLYENTQVTNSCVNCHTFCKGDPNRSSVHFRGKYGATMLQIDGTMTALESRTDSTLGTAVYPYWHPSGQYIAYSTNQVRQLFHTTATDLMETFDMNSDVYVYDINANQIFYNQGIKNNDFFETNPAFSADGKSLYFCRATRREMPKEVTKVRYDLCRIDFNPENGNLGDKIDTLVMVSDAGKSISLPRPTSDGKYLVYTQTNYGCFPLYHKEADLWILNLETLETAPMSEVNSDYADAFHNFSSNDRWLVFGSRREDGMHTRPYFAYVDKEGVGRKPFLLPQREPKEYYSNLMLSYNCVEFVNGPVDFDSRIAGSMLYSGSNKQMKVANQNKKE